MNEKQQQQRHLLLKSGRNFHIVPATRFARLFFWPWVVFEGSEEQCRLETFNY